jgi:hypothetical protein
VKATQGKSGFNVTGYRDYRGVPVYGAWLWDDKLDMARSLTVAPFCDELFRLADARKIRTAAEWPKAKR